MNITRQGLFDFYAPYDLPMKGILSIPHSGEMIPEEFKAYLTPNQKVRDQDLDYQVQNLVDIEALRKMGVAVLVSHIHRICIDLNRPEAQCLLGWKENTQGEKIVLKEPDEEDAHRLVYLYHSPYFELFKAMLSETKNRKKRLPVIDLHSMPSVPTDYHLQKNPAQTKERADFCISDLKGKSCEKNYLNIIVSGLKTTNTVSINDPYLGGHITQFASGFPNINVAQIEINRKLYMNESEISVYVEKCVGLKETLMKMLTRVYTESN